MREHLFLPKPIFPRHVVFPDFIGGYRNYPEHRVNREYRSTDLGLDRYYNLHLRRSAGRSPTSCSNRG
ncbi:hypothetical protein [Cohnella fermenti]|uniref:hypothetical protein n=1 Tax=Cohnella fermenti TaxID=2565925 RepID=UPI001E314827|nr:hypothetical protein [Cohnella fermenti]